MKLIIYEGVENFGDVIGLRLADVFFPRVLDDDAREQLLMVGTMIDRHAPAGTEQIVIGAGTGYRTGRPSLLRRTVYAVRGPLTARAMGLEPRLGCIDPGFLFASTHGVGGDEKVPSEPLFMPHWRTDLSSGEGWRRACAMARVGYCSPLDDPERILRRIRRAPVVITEALHGAIVAESCGVAWIPLVVGPHVLGFKWRDWCASIGIEWAPRLDLPTLRRGPVSWSDRGKLLAHRLGIGKEKYRRLALDPDGPAAIERAAAMLSDLVLNGEAHHHRGVVRVRDEACDRLLDAFDRFRRDRLRRTLGRAPSVA